jgi:hypothetical protein
MSDTAYISRNLSVCPAEAATLADEWQRRLGETAKGSRFIRYGNRLWLSSELSPIDGDRLGVRRATGLLWVAGRPRRIEFEMTVWSTTTTTLAIRPRSPKPVVFSLGYAAAAYRALEDVSQSLLITRECLNARADSYRSVREILLDRKFEWPARAVPDPAPFPRPAPVEEGSPRVTAASH